MVSEWRRNVYNYLRDVILKIVLTPGGGLWTIIMSKNYMYKNTIQTFQSFDEFCEHRIGLIQDYALRRTLDQDCDDFMDDIDLFTTVFPCCVSEKDTCDSFSSDRDLLDGLIEDYIRLHGQKCFEMIFVYVMPYKPIVDLCMEYL